MSDSTPMQVLAFEDMLKSSMQEFLAASKELGEPIIQLGHLVKDAFDKCRDFLEYGLTNRAPADEAAFFNQQPLSAAIHAIQQFRQQNRQNAEFFHHISAVSESIVALSWITIKPAPVQFIRDMKDAGQYYGNRVLGSFKGKSNHVNWVNNWVQVLKDLELYVKQYFTTGFTWSVAQGRNSQAPVAPPPPPPPAPFGDSASINADSSDSLRQALNMEINQGLGITNKLKPVSRDGSHTEAKHAQPISKAPIAPVKSPQKTHAPKFELEGRKWVVAHQENNLGMSLDNSDMSHSLLMYSCNNSFIKVPNKVNNIVIDSCKKTSIVVKDVISSVEVIRCDRLKIQCEGSVPLINISSSDSVQVFLTESSRNTELIASKSSALNVCLIKPDGDYVEFPVPEQIKSVLAGGRLISTVVENI